MALVHYSMQEREGGGVYWILGFFGGGRQQEGIWQKGSQKRRPNLPKTVALTPSHR